MPSFPTIWSNHPSRATPSDDYPCRDKKGSIDPKLDNQCAIRLALALQRSGVSLKTMYGARCWYGHGHVLRALQLRSWIDANGSMIGWTSKAIDTSVTDADYKGRQGIVFWEDFWGTHNTGDHIDLWDGTQVAKGSSDYFQRSRRVWFWEF